MIIGTTGTSYYDGNVFGGGRGFSGDAQTAGTVGGNVRLNINAGSVYGSVYGGGRLASVGTMFEFPTLTNGDPNPSYGNFKEDEGGNTYGYVTVNISGGEIGRDFSTLTTYQLVPNIVVMYLVVPWDAWICLMVHVTPSGLRWLR